VQCSRQWKQERVLGAKETDCILALLPFGSTTDISFNFIVGQHEGLNLLQDLQTKGGLERHLLLVPISSAEDVQYQVSRVGVQHLHALGSPLLHAMQASRQWKEEQRGSSRVTDCLIAFVPRSDTGDISFRLTVSRTKGLDMIRKLEMLELQGL
jgi:lipid A disaccharide synthetase